MINEYHFDDLILGGSIESLLYCYLNNKKLLIINNLYPFELEKLSYCDSLRLLGYSNDETIYKSEVWDRLSLLMCLNGSLVMPNIVKNHRQNDERIVLVTDHNKRVIITADNIIEFDNIKDDYYFVYDWFNVRSGNNHDKLLISDDDKFIKNIHFYTAKRIGGNNRMKDLVGESIMTEDQINSPNYSEGIARLKILRMMKANGIKGQSNGVRSNYAIKIEHTHRQILLNYQPASTTNEITENEVEIGEQWNLTKKLFRHKQITTLQGSFRLPANL